MIEPRVSIIELLVVVLAGGVVANVVASFLARRGARRGLIWPRPCAE